MTPADEARGRLWVAGSAALFCAAAVLLPLAGPAPLDFAFDRSRLNIECVRAIQSRIARQ